MADNKSLEQLRTLIQAMEKAPQPIRSDVFESHDAKPSQTERVPIQQGEDAPPKALREEKKPTAFSKVVALINRRELSSLQLEKKLLEKGYAAQEVHDALQRAEQAGIVDDARFASALVRSRLLQGRGLDGISRELSQHGIDPDSVEGWPDGFTDGLGSEEQRAIEFLNAHPPRAKNLREGAYRKLVSRGFSTSAASSAARRFAEGKQLL
jgi:regulatory protein